MDGYRAFFQKAAPFAAPGGSLSYDQVGLMILSFAPFLMQQYVIPMYALRLQS